ncbi:MAG TPA: tetratricopeptide repeat protein [Gemmatimonadaceae bacterium]|nr:tetratricopeptide repeat protein [Gemmatimonadaceae bacterium]
MRLQRIMLAAGLVPCALGAQTAAEHFKAGRAALDSNKADAAVKEFEHAVKLEDKNADYHLWLGNALGTVAQHASVLRQPFLAKRVKSEFERTVALDPASIDGHDGLMQFYLEAPGFMGGSMAKARGEADEIAKINPLRGHFARATIANHEKDQPAVEREYRAAATEFPDTLGAVVPLVNLLATSSRPDEAFALLDKYLARKPNDLAGLFQVGRTAAITGKQLDRGEQALRAVLAAPGVGSDPALPAPASAHYRLGDIAAKRGAKAQARTEYERAIELNPRFEAARRALKAL